MSDWSDAEAARLEELWADSSLSTAAIGALLHRSKNAVVGRAHRQELPPRPSPIIRPGDPRNAPPAVPRVRRTSLPLLPSLRNPFAVPKELAAKGKRRAAKPRQCEWREGETRPFVQCTANAERGRPYCAAHCRACYRPKGAAPVEAPAL